MHPQGRPHVVPLLAVWMDGALYFCAGDATRKAKNLKHNPHYVITTGTNVAHLVVEGEAVQMRDEMTLQRVADEYASKYDWQVIVRDHAFYADGAPTAGPPPYKVYEVIPAKVFGFGTGETFSPTRWLFAQESA